MRAERPDAAEIEAGWRYYLFNWIAVGVMAAALALRLMTANVSLELASLAVAIGYVGLCEGFADAHARSRLRCDPRGLFMLGGMAQILLIVAIMAPFIRVAAPASAPPGIHSLLAAWLSFGDAMIRWSIFAVPAVLAAAKRYRRTEEFTFAFGVASVATAILPALLSGIDGRLTIVPNLQAAAAVLFVWGLSPLRWTRPMVIVAFAAMLTTMLFGGDLIGIVAGSATAVLAIGAARGVGCILARRQVGAVSAAMSVAVPAE
jgi:hypothetical protein